MDSEYDFVVLGDICLDWYSENRLSLPFDSFYSRQDIAEWTNLIENPGGSSLLFAVATRDLGFKPFLIGKIGNDLTGKYILDWLRSQNISYGISTTDNASTGKVFMTYDSEGRRLLIANSPNANSLLSLNDIEQYEEVISASKALYVSGHCFREPKALRYKATMRLMEVARLNMKEIIFDVVPHEFYKIYPKFSQFKKLTKGVTILISEVSTMRRVLGLGELGENISQDLVRETLDKLTPLYKRIILRFGLHGIGSQMVWDGLKNTLSLQNFDFPKYNRRGYGDKFAVLGIQELLNY